MAIVNEASKEVQFKIVYCGTPMSGKTTNLTYVHSQLDENIRGDLISIETAADRTLFFDLLPVSVEDLNGFKTKFQIYTVPGQVAYNATRQLVLKGVDGIVFVADSSMSRMEENLASLKNMLDTLPLTGTQPGSIPIILQYNKRDAPDAASVDVLDSTLNRMATPLLRCEAVASNGKNVMATLNQISKMVLQRFHESRARAAEAAKAARAATSIPKPRETAPQEPATIVSQ